MPEYLSPGVYVEEVEAGPRPIEGVSTSTAGNVGVAERGPENVPILVTSFAEYQRVFGGYLDPAAFPDTWYLPIAAEGFFQNGGQRLYVARVASDGAERAELTLMDRGAPDAYSSPLEALVSEGDTYLLVADAPALAGGETLRIDDGAATEYVVADAGPFPATATRVETLRQPTYAAYAAGTAVTVATIAAAGGNDAFNSTLTGAVTSGASSITLAGRPVAPANDLSQGNVLRIHDPADPKSDECVIVEMVPAIASDTTITLRHPLALAHPDGATVERVTETGTGAATALSQAVAAGTTLIVLDNATMNPGDIVRIGGAVNTDTSAAYYVVADLQVLGLDTPAVDEHVVGEVVSHLTLTANAGTNGNLTEPASAGDDLIHLDPGDLAEDNWIEVQGATAEFAQIAELPTSPPNTVRLRQPLRHDHLAGDAVVRQDRTAGTPYTRLLQHLHVGATTVLLADGTPDFDVNTFVEIGAADAPGREYHVLGPQGSLALIPLATGSAATRAHRAGVNVQLRAALFDVVALDRGGWGNRVRVAVEEEDSPLVQTTSSGAGPMANIPLASLSGVENGTLLEFLAVSTELAARAAAGAGGITVQSAAGIGAGARLRIGRSYPEYVTVAGAPAADVITLTQPLRRAHAQREPVDLMDLTGLPRMAKVERRIGSTAVRLEGGGLAAAVAPNTIVRSREFKLIVEWAKQNARRPNEEILVEAETHRYLSLDDRHSRYAPRVIGSVNGPIRLWDRRPEGESNLIRIDDPLAPLDTETTIRPGPDLIFETLPSGRRRAVRRWLSGGDDDIAGVVDDTYRGLDNVDPLLRTGLQTLKNEEDISLVAIPGRTSDVVQDELITHCELMRYRFALLDSIPGTAPTGAALSEVQAQRQQFDSKYAALYYPWLLREHPFPANPAISTNLAVPPSGHMAGIYARTDVTRGVHKAPANEVIRGSIGLQRALTKGEQDVLNPVPMNINVLRDFRLQNRGLRVWGARVITSDPAWRYVNVRRLFNFVERSIELGTHWSVFEPNDQNLWAQVRRSIGNFLNLVWRSGGLMGATAEEAYFVKCDMTTMTPADIDAGRLIVVIGIAPTKPAEFVVIRIGQSAVGATVEEA